MDATPYRQIRALYDAETITVYQAYSAEIAVPAVQHQKLSASPAFSSTRTTWIKPSWCWMMYRAGYSYKDARQSHILALKMKHEHFRALLMHATVVSHEPQRPLTSDEKEKEVRVQWDPERDPRLARLPYRSIQIGIQGRLGRRWTEDWIGEIVDVTDVAREMKRVLDENADVDEVELKRRGLMPDEKVYGVDDELREVLQMDEKE